MILDRLSVHHSNRNCGGLQVCVLWSGQEGSLLFWSLLLRLMDWSCASATRPTSACSRMLRWSSPGCRCSSYSAEFRRPSVRPDAGPIRRTAPAESLCNTLNGNSSPDALLGLRGDDRTVRLRTGRVDHALSGEKWIHITRRWTMVAWGFLTCGIFLARTGPTLCWDGWVLGLDPVENASLMRG